MNRLIVGFSVLLGLGLASPSRRTPAGAVAATLQDTLIGIEKQSWDAWKKRDGAFFQTFLSDDHVEVGAGGVSTKSAVVAFVGSPACVVKSYTGDDFKLTAFNENTAVLTYRAEQTTVCNGKPVPSPAVVTSLYIRRNGRWLNALYEQTPARTPVKSSGKP